MLFEFFDIHAEHSHDEFFCFSIIDLKTLSASTGAAADLGVISILLVEGKAVAFPNEI